MGKQADQYFNVAPWTVSETGFDPEHGRVAESIFAVANEYAGVRGYFEEGYSGDRLQGSYFNGVYVHSPEDTTVQYAGIQKRSHFMVNAVDWLAVVLRLDGEKLDLNHSQYRDFSRTLDLKSGVLTRQFTWVLADGRELALRFERFLSMVTASQGFQRITATALNFEGDLDFSALVDFDTRHGDGSTSYWEDVRDFSDGLSFGILGQTKGTSKRVFSLAALTVDPAAVAANTELRGTRQVGRTLRLHLEAGRPLTVVKRVTNLVQKAPAASNHAVWTAGQEALAAQPDYDTALAAQRAYWDAFWTNHDIQIDGDDADQQGIRYCLFQMAQTYHGEDATNNIGAKGLTGEAYGGLAFWDTETMCLPFYLFTDLKAAKNLVEYRYSTLEAAKRRAKMVDCLGASYPISTINGDEATCLWQHANTQLQPSTAVAYAVFHYARISGDAAFLYGHGAQMLTEISRFLYSRGDWNRKHEFSFYGVMGPDEFQVMVNHDAYTNYMGQKTFAYTLAVLAEMKARDAKAYAALVAATGVTDAELANWQDAADHMVFLGDNNGLIEQQAGFFDLPHVDVAKIPVTDFPLYDHWSYDRLFRNDMIKQPDVLMFQFLYSQDFSLRSKRLNYDYYTPRTIHESSLSPSIHSIAAQELHRDAGAYRFFGFATRMDLDNYNRNTRDGLHTTSIAAAWLNIVYGFGGLRSDGPELILNPGLPAKWRGYRFGLSYRGATIHVAVAAKQVTLTASAPVALKVYGKQVDLTTAPLTLDVPAIWQTKQEASHD
ncbi:glycoside hydrolase family 65 protein [Lacticaseibacillus kribbianus]|uniref:glycoside hydrolase family 65 protein n=1 Tax=Lacticaseibacillus kribbianus TaxID=2926292 RepID=UPI001CD402BD|nr:glycosyl hydrolase family 65 protein [Lacticaseibacillus kribbianus]